MIMPLRRLGRYFIIMARAGNNNNNNRTRTHMRIDYYSFIEGREPNGI